MAKSMYTAVTRIKTGGKRYLPGESLELTADEAKTFGTAVQKGGKAPAAAGSTAAGATGAAGAAGAGTGDTDPLADVEFASPQAGLRAKELLAEGKLTPDSFKHQRKESEKGFTVADVDRIAEKGAGGE